jgi:hypothetical protein
VPVLPGDLKLLGPLQRWPIRLNGQTVDGYKIRFSIRNAGEYTAYVPVDGLTFEMIQNAMVIVATPVIAALDAFGTDEG